jgi:hypothetical protein
MVEGGFKNKRSIRQQLLRFLTLWGNDVPVVVAISTYKSSHHTFLIVLKILASTFNLLATTSGEPRHGGDRACPPQKHRTRLSRTRSHNLYAARDCSATSWLTSRSREQVRHTDGHRHVVRPGATSPRSTHQRWSRRQEPSY